MDIKEKNELIEVIKTDIKNVASLEAKGQFEEAKKMHSELEGKLTKSLEGMVSKEDFDKAENELKKSIKAFEDKTAKNVTFEGALMDNLTKSQNDLGELRKGALKSVSLDIYKDPGTLTTVNSIVGSNTVAGQFAIFNNREIVPIARRSRHIREVFGMGATDDAVYPYLRETPKEGAVAVQNPEGAAKAQTEYQFTLVNATESTIAHWQKIGRQTLSNVRGLASFIQTTMISDLLLKEDADLLFANGTNGAVLGVFSAPLTDADIVAGFTTINPNLYDCIAAVAATLAAREYIASAAMVNPVDYWKMVIEKDQDERYQQNVLFDAASSMLYVFGIPVIATTAIPAGGLGVADGRYVMPLQREGISLRFFDQDEDNVQRNLITVRAEERILNVVRRSDAFYFDTIANTKAAIATT
jgi:hypothetical protein